MHFERIKEKIKDIPLDALRVDCDNLFEAVVVKVELEKFIKSLEEFFGPPAWPSKISLSFHVRKVIDDFGGVMPGQTLYVANKGADAIFAMLWPWQDGVRTTVKIFKAP